MNLETSLSESLWKEIQQNYESGRYTDAIKDSIYFLSNIIREKANLEGDGVQLIGEAFGGSDPKIKVTKLQTENDKNIQRGIEALLRGLFQAVRNPRSHEKYSDPKEDSDAIILFIDYLIRVVNQAKAQFSVEDFLPRVFDSSFVPTSRYADLLVAEIPEKKRMDVMLEVLKRKERGDCAKVHFFFRSLLGLMDAQQQDEVFRVISLELRGTDAFETIKSVVQIIEPSAWSRIHEVPRLRIENKFIESIQEGLYNQATEKCISGALGTWGTRLFPHFVLKNEAMNVITGNLLYGPPDKQAYLVKFVAAHLPMLAPEPEAIFQAQLIAGIEDGNRKHCDAAKLFKSRGGKPWTEPFTKAIKEFKPREENKIASDDFPF